MKIAVIGCGYLGAVHAACMAEIGHDVIGIDVDGDRVASLQAGSPNFYEPGLKEMIERNLSSGRLNFSTDTDLLDNIEVYFIGVGTPMDVASGSGKADLSYVHAAIQTITNSISGDELNPALIVGKSTVPVGTAREIESLLSASEVNATLVWNPEFLREGFGIEDTLSPDRIVYGLPDDPQLAQYSEIQLDQCYSPVLRKGMPKLSMSYESAELVKVAANSFLATKLSFINAIGDLCDATGADVTTVASAIGLDERIGRRFLKAGIGYGGGCLPKDVAALTARSNELGIDTLSTLLESVQTINESRILRSVEIVSQELGGVAGKKIAVLGASFKPISDDLRESRSILISNALSNMGASVWVTDPMAIPHVTSAYPHLRSSESIEETLRGADAVLLLTEWDEYVKIDPDHIFSLVKNPMVFDGRNSLDPMSWIKSGFAYHSLGRNSAQATRNQI